MSQRVKYLFKNMGILTISNFASKFMIFLLVPLYTSVLSTEEYGKYDLIVSTVTLLYPILTANIIDAVMRFAMDEQRKKDDAASIGLRYVTISFVLFGLGLLGSWVFHLFPSLDGLRGYVFLYYLFFVLNQYFLQLAKGLERIKEMGIAGIVSSVVLVIANVVFLLVVKLGLRGFFIANILGQAVPVVYYFIRLQYWKMVRQTSWGSSLEKEMIAYCVPLILTSLGWWANSTADKYIVALMCGVAANGLLSVAYKIPSVLSNIQQIFIQAWQVSVIKEYDKGGASTFYGKTFAYINVIMSAVCSVLTFLSKPLARILFAKDFYEAWRYAPFLLVSSVMNCATGFIGPILSAKKDSKSMAMSAVYGTGMNVVMNILLIHFMGVQGATIATALSSYVTYVIRRRAAKEDLYIRNYWKVLVTWVLLCLQAAVEIYTGAWYAEIGIMGILLLINADVIREMFRYICDNMREVRKG